MKHITDRPEIADRLATTAADRARHRMGLPPWASRPGTRERVWLLSALCLVLTGLLFTAGQTALSSARDGVQVIGGGEGAKVKAATDLYFALSDMDAQMANVLLMGSEDSLRDARNAAMHRYEQSRDDANGALLLAAQLAEGDGIEEQSLRAVMDEMNAYERKAAEARLLNDEQSGPAGRPSEEAVELYRQAAERMQLDLLPKAYNLTLDSGATVRSTYEEKSSAVSLGLALVAAATAGLVGSLVWLQLFLRKRFRRRYNLPLAAATAGVLVLGLSTIAMLGQQSEMLRTAKEEGLDSMLALSQARAISIGMNADQSRWLMDPDQAHAYEQNFLDGAKRVLFLDPYIGEPPHDLDAYTAEVGGAVKDHTDYPGRMLNLLGEEVHTGGIEGREEAQQRTLRAYAAFLEADRKMRDLVADGDVEAAVNAHMLAEDSVDDRFGEYERSLAQLTALHTNTYDTAVESADTELRGWDTALTAWCLAFAALLVLGVRPRLAEYR